jgi:hypothetical protein
MELFKPIPFLQDCTSVLSWTVSPFHVSDETVQLFGRERPCAVSGTREFAQEEVGDEYFAATYYR